MKSIFIDCSLGISGDMLASAFFNLGVPQSIFLDNLVSLNTVSYTHLRAHET